MPKCRINNDNEIINFWNDSHPAIPEDALNCDTVKSVKGSGPPDNVTYFYKLVDGKVIPTEAGVAWEVQEYSRNRATAYPSTGDQLDMMYKDTKNSTTTHADAVEAVKTKWPKDNSGPV